MHLDSVFGAILETNITILDKYQLVCDVTLPYLFAYESYHVREPVIFISQLMHAHQKAIKIFRCNLVKDEGRVKRLVLFCVRKMKNNFILLLF